MPTNSLINFNSNHLRDLVKTTLLGEGDSDRHVLVLYSIALASHGKVFVELGVRDGTTTFPILSAANENKGILYSVDINDSSFKCPDQYKENWNFVKSDALVFLSQWDESKKIDFIYIDDWHSYEHVKKELELIDKLISPSGVVLLHDLMWGNHAPFYHCDLTLKTGQWANGGPYRAVCELNPQFWEWSTLPWNNGLTILRKKYSSKYHPR
jgi:predicted O-methyltransferase YrrM